MDKPRKTGVLREVRPRFVEPSDAFLPLPDRELWSFLLIPSGFASPSDEEGNIYNLSNSEDASADAIICRFSCRRTSGSAKTRSPANLSPCPDRWVFRIPFVKQLVAEVESAKVAILSIRPVRVLRGARTAANVDEEEPCMCLCMFGSMRLHKVIGTSKRPRVVYLQT